MTTVNKHREIRLVYALVGTIFLVLTFAIISFSVFIQKDLGQEIENQFNNVISETIKQNSGDLATIISSDFDYSYDYTNKLENIISHSAFDGVVLHVKESNQTFRVPSNLSLASELRSNQRLSVYDIRENIPHLDLMTREYESGSTLPPVLGEISYITNTSSIDKTLRGVQLFGLGIAVLIIVFLTLIVTVLFKYTSRFMNSALSATYSLSRGDYNVNLEEKTIFTEFNIFARNMNKVARKLDEQTQNIKTSEALVRSEKNFLSNAAHELRSPMINMKLRVHSIDSVLKNMKTADPAEVNLARSMTTAALYGIGRMNNEILSIIANKGLETGQLKVPVVKFDPRTITEDFIKWFSRDRVFANSIKLRSSYEFPEGTIVTGKLNLMSVCVNNILGNAEKFTRTGEIRVICFLKHIPQLRLCYVVEDTGCGMTQTEVKALLSGVYPKDMGGTKRNKEGHGIGFKSVLSFVEYLGGEVNVESTVGKGTRVEIEFNIEDFSYPDENTPALVPIKEPENKPTLSLVGSEPGEILEPSKRVINDAVRILIVEDSEDTVQSISENVILTMQGLVSVSINVSREPNTALNYAKNEAYDIILVDYHMPDIDGIEFLQELDKHINAKSANAYKIFMTADSAFLTSKSNELNQVQEICDIAIDKANVSETLDNVIRNCFIRKISK